MPPQDSSPYKKLMAALDDLDRWGLLKPGVRPDLALMVWASTHGMATLLVEGAVPPDMSDSFIESLSRLIMTEGGV